MERLAGNYCLIDFEEIIEKNTYDNKPILIDDKMTSNYLTIKQIVNTLNSYVDDAVELNDASIIDALKILGIEKCVKSIKIDNNQENENIDNYVYVLDELVSKEYLGNIYDVEMGKLIKKIFIRVSLLDLALVILEIIFKLNLVAFLIGLAIIILYEAYALYILKKSIKEK